MYAYWVVVNHLKKILDISLMVLGIGSVLAIALTIFIATAMGKRTSDLDLTRTESNCNLANGYYKVLYDKEFSEYKPFEFKVENDTLIKIITDEKMEYKIEWITDKNFQLKPLKNQTDSSTKMDEKIKSLGIPFYELTKCNQDTMHFNFRLNLHIMFNSGKIIRMQ